jgi:hypothetical protein
VCAVQELQIIPWSPPLCAESHRQAGVLPEGEWIKKPQSCGLVLGGTGAGLGTEVQHQAGSGAGLPTSEGRVM